MAVRDLPELYLRRSIPPPPAEAIRAFEVQFGVTLPAYYLHFLSLANGGEPMLDCTFNYTTALGDFVEDADQVAEFFALTVDPKGGGGIWSNTQYLLNELEAVGKAENVVCIARNSDFDYVYLDMSTGPPCVRILYCDFKETIPTIADSFGEFLVGLHYQR